MKSPDIPGRVKPRGVDGAATLPGGLTIEDFAEATGVELADGDYETVAGYVIARLGRIPEVGDAVLVDDTRIEVAEMDGRRIAKVSIAPAPVEEGDGEESQP